jgi:SAM-dependent methyltransferase
VSEPTRLDDPAVVRREYASDERFRVRAASYRFAEGPDPTELLFEAIAATAPRRFVEVGCGSGWLSERVQRELGCEVVAFDQSEYMVEEARARGVDARVGDVRDLPLADGEFDCAAAAWMLYHVSDVDGALAELSRVLRSGGRLVAVTNSRTSLRELADLLGVERTPYTFSAENGAELLRRHFQRVERHDADGWLVFPSRREAQEHVDNTIVWRGLQLPPFEGPLRVRRAAVVFAADKA